MRKTRRPCVHPDFESAVSTAKKAVKEAIPKADAEAALKKLVDAGAKAEVK